MGEENKGSTIVRLINDPTLAARITAPELEHIFEEFKKFLQICLMPMQELFDKYYEGSLSIAEWEQNATRNLADQLRDTARVMNILREERNDDGALAWYYQRAFFHCNPQNLEMILAIMDPDTRNDGVRTSAFTLATVFGLYANSTFLNWKLSTGLRCATMLLFQCAKSLEFPLEQEIRIGSNSFLKHEDDDSGGNFFLLNRLMLKCTKLSKDPLMRILNHISTLNWWLILNNERADHVVFSSVADLLLRQASFEECRPEVTTMRQVFGSCFGLLRRVLKRILLVRLEHTWPLEDRADFWKNFLGQLVEFFSVFYIFMTGPPPHDIELELDVLFGCAHKTLSDAKPHLVSLLTTSEQLECYDMIIDMTRPDQWTERKNFSSSHRQTLWDKKVALSSVLLLPRKQVRRAHRDRYSYKGPLGPSVGTSLCVNCFKVEEGLQMCSGCKEVSYCGKNCQVEHWERTHQHTCKKMKECTK